MLKISGLKAGYDGKAVVELNTLSLPSGEHLLLLGQSGSGKTTLLYAIGGLLTPLAGEVTLAGTRINPGDDEFRGTHIGIIYQTLHMVPALTVLENLLLAPYAAGLPQDAAKAESLLAALGLLELRHRKPHELSQGQQQRVAIARAAMNGPKLILGDEPTSALDDASAAAVMELLLAAARTVGASLVIATHDARIKKYFTHTITLGGAQ